MHALARAFILLLTLFPVSASASTVTYWNVFNIEDERAISADIVTYGTLADMLGDTNRLGVFQPAGGGAGQNVVGTGSDGTTYWNVFNIEGERAISADIVTYGTLGDMLADTNRLGVFQPAGGGAGQNVVGSGATALRAPPPPPAVIPLPASAWLSLSALALLFSPRLGRGRRTARAWRVALIRGDRVVHPWSGRPDSN